MKLPAELLTDGLKQLSLSPQLVPILLDYLALLEKWNQAYNLTAIRDQQQMIIKHVLDSLSLLPHVQGPRVLDIGTGAGLPGLMLAIARPDWQCFLLDSNGKKIRFVQQAVAELNLNNVTAIHCRSEQFQPPHLFQTVTSRAYSSLSLFCQQALPLCAEDGQLLAMKGDYPTEELAVLADQSWHFEVFPLYVPGLEARRHAVRLHPRRPVCH